MARISQDPTSWKASGLARKYKTLEEDRQVGPKAKSKRDRRRWCKGIEGRRHDIQVVTITERNERCFEPGYCGHWRHDVERCVNCRLEMTRAELEQMELAEKWCQKGHLYDWRDRVSRYRWQGGGYEEPFCVMCGKVGKSRKKES